MATSPFVPLRVAIIGCGRPATTATGFGMAHRHMAGYVASGRCELVAVADINRDNATAFITEHNPRAHVFGDAREMMEQVRPDLVSICLWPHLHASTVETCAPFQPRAILCEKPMDIHWDAALRMHEVCKQHGVLLAINHQRRFNLPIARAKEFLQAGEIGALRRLEGAWHNLADAGTHVLDLMFFFNDDTPAEWVLGQVDARGSTRYFGAINAGHGIAELRFRNGVRGIYHFGCDHAEAGCLLRITGEAGEIEILFEAPWLRVRRAGQVTWEIVDTGESIHDDKAIYRGIAEIISCIGTNQVPQLGSERALRATEVIFAVHESSRRRARIDLPLPPGRCAFLTMLEHGEIKE